jgi:hypothetical protein
MSGEKSFAIKKLTDLYTNASPQDLIHSQPPYMVSPPFARAFSLDGRDRIASVYPASW